MSSQVWGAPLHSRRQAALQRSEFQEAQANKRKHDALLQAQWAAPPRSEGPCLAAPEVPPRSEAASAFGAPPMPAPPTPARGEGAPEDRPSRRLCWQSMVPQREEDFFGNKDARDKARLWLKRWQQKTPSPVKVSHGMLLLYGHCGTGKSYWARWILIQAGYTICEFTPFSAGRDRPQTLHFFLQTQTHVDVKGRRLAVVLDDVDQLFLQYPEAALVKTACLVIATCGPTPTSGLRMNASENLRFSRLNSWESGKLVRRWWGGSAPRETVVDSIVAEAQGDLRQLLWRCSNASWRAASGEADILCTGYELAKLALYATQPLPDLSRGDFDGNYFSLFEDSDRLSQQLILENFHHVCGTLAAAPKARAHDDSAALLRLEGFLQDACLVDARRLMPLLPRIARLWRARWRAEASGALPAPRFDALLPPLAMPLEADQADRKGTSAGQEEDFGTRAVERPRHDWKPPPPRFKKGLQFAAELLRTRLGDDGLKDAALRELEQPAFLSASLRLAAASTPQFCTLLCR